MLLYIFQIIYKYYVVSGIKILKGLPVSGADKCMYVHRYESNASLLYTYTMYRYIEGGGSNEMLH